TGTMADHRLRLPSSQIGAYLLMIVKELAAGHRKSLKNPAALPAQLPADITAILPEKWVKAVTRDLAEHTGRSAIIVGHRQSAWIHALAHAINDSLGNIA